MTEFRPLNWWFLGEFAPKKPTIQSKDGLYFLDLSQHAKGKIEPVPVFCPLSAYNSNAFMDIKVIDGKLWHKESKYCYQYLITYVDYISSFSFDFGTGEVIYKNYDGLKITRFAQDTIIRKGIIDKNNSFLVSDYWIMDTQKGVLVPLNSDIFTPRYLQLINSL